MYKNRNYAVMRSKNPSWWPDRNSSPIALLQKEQIQETRAKSKKKHSKEEASTKQQQSGKVKTYSFSVLFKVKKKRCTFGFLALSLEIVSEAGNYKIHDEVSKGSFSKRELG